MSRSFSPIGMLAEMLYIFYVESEMSISIFPSLLVSLVTV